MMDDRLWYIMNTIAVLEQPKAKIIIFRGWKDCPRTQPLIEKADIFKYRAIRAHVSRKKDLSVESSLVDGGFLITFDGRSASIIDLRFAGPHLTGHHAASTHPDHGIQHIAKPIWFHEHIIID